MKKRNIVLFILMLSLVVSVGCNNKASDDTETNSSEDESSGKIVNYGLTTAWDSLNPYGTSSGSLFTFLTHDKIFDRLVMVREGATQLDPRGATSWESSEDGLTATFHLNEDARFHDDTPVTANDWVYTLELITNKDFNPTVKSEFNVIAGTDDTGTETSDKSVAANAPDDYTLEIEFKNPIPIEDFLVLKNRFLYVLPKHILEEIDVTKVMEDDFWSAPVGSGPFKYNSEIIGSKLELDAFENYHLGAPDFDKLFLTVVSPTNTVTAVKTGELDYFYEGPKIEDTQVAETQGLDVLNSEFPISLNSLIINNQNIDDKKIRQAIDMAVDKEMLLEMANQGEGKVAKSYILPGSEYENNKITWERDVEGAKKLLEEANWDASKVLKMAVGEPRKNQAALIQQNLAEAGIEIEILIVDVATMFSGLSDGKYDLGMSGSSANNYPIWMEGYYDYRNKTYAQISDERYAEYQEEISSELDHEKRVELVKEYQEFMNDEMPISFLWHADSFAIHSDKITNMNPFDSTVYNDAVWEWEVK